MHLIKWDLNIKPGQEIPRQQCCFSRRSGSPHGTSHRSRHLFNRRLEHLGESQPFNLKKKGSEAESQVIWLSGSHPHKNKQNSNWKRLGLRVSRKAQRNPGWCISEEGASTITEALDPYGDTLPLLTQPAVAEATCHNRETLPTGWSQRQQGGASTGK